MRDIRQYTLAQRAVDAFKANKSTVLFHGDCADLIEKLPDDSVSLTIASPPYCMGKEYDRSQTVDDFIADQKRILPEIVRVTKPGGSICWQVGYHVKAGGATYPLDYAVFNVLQGIAGVILRNRIIWTYGHGLQARHKFSGRHETIMWFTKGDRYAFDLDAVREPQKYPGKRRSNGPRKGEFSGNPLGKNPSDVWAIPNVKAKHLEKMKHPCQFPVALAIRLVRALSPADGVVFDPYMGTATTGVAAVLSGRRFLGAETKKKYVTMARERLVLAHNGTVPYRPLEKPIFVPHAGLAVARRPAHFVEYAR